MMPFSAVWAGPERDEHLEAPPLFFARTEGSTPFRFSLHVGDVGHTLIVGPTGAGKSVLLALMALQFRRYPARRSSPSTSAGRSGRPRSPWAATGTSSAARWPDDAIDARRPAAARPHRRCRRARLGRRMDRRVLARESVTVTPEVKEHLWSALTSLASAPVAGAHADRPFGAAAVQRAEAGACSPTPSAGP